VTVASLKVTLFAAIGNVASMLAKLSIDLCSRNPVSLELSDQVRVTLGCGPITAAATRLLGAVGAARAGDGNNSIKSRATTMINPGFLSATFLFIAVSFTLH
jgi:hypothetical protein